MISEKGVSDEDWEKVEGVLRGIERNMVGGELNMKKEELEKLEKILIVKSFDFDMGKIKE